MSNGGSSCRAPSPFARISLASNCAVLRAAARMPRRPGRLLALAVISDGGTRSEAARLGNVTLQIVRDWVLRFNAEGPPGLIDRRAAGPTPLLNDAHRAALAAILERGRCLRSMA